MMSVDLISRSELIKAMSEVYPLATNEMGGVVNKRIYEIIDNAPTVNTTCPNCDSGYAQGYSDGYLRGKEERPKGEWVTKNIVDPYGKCNQCGEICEVNNFCGNCGAEMRGGKQ